MRSTQSFGKLSTLADTADDISVKVVPDFA